MQCTKWVIHVISSQRLYREPKSGPFSETLNLRRFDAWKSMHVVNILKYQYMIKPHFPHNQNIFMRTDYMIVKYVILKLYTYLQPFLPLSWETRPRHSGQLWTARLAAECFKKDWKPLYKGITLLWNCQISKGTCMFSQTKVISTNPFPMRRYWVVTNMSGAFCRSSCMSGQAYCILEHILESSLYCPQKPLGHVKSVFVYLFI